MQLIVGMGVSGLSVAKFLIKQNQAFIVYDDYQTPNKLADFLALNAKCYCGSDEYLDFSIIKRAIISPGIPNKHKLINKLKQHHIPVISDIELFGMNAKAKIIGITGSNGKSTLTHLITKIARDQGKKAVMAGNIGVAALDALSNEVELYVLELSSYQLDLIQKIKLHIAIVLNITPDHLERYSSFDDYRQSKLSIYSYAKYAVIDRDQADSIATDNAIYYGLGLPQSTTQFGTMVYNGKRFFTQGNIRLLPTSSIKLIGLHNVSNILAAFSIGYKLGLKIPQMLKTAQSFTAVPHRLEWVACKGGIHYYNDSKATNADASCAALEAIQQQHDLNISKLALIIGGIAKGNNYQLLANKANAICDYIFCIGDARKTLAFLFDVHKTKCCLSLAIAVENAQKQLDSGIILFSPAGASFDQFDNFEQRGNVFKSLIMSD